jgi:signal transduction histidine kinase
VLDPLATSVGASWLPVFLEGMSVNGERLIVGQTSARNDDPASAVAALRLPSKVGSVEVRFTAINFTEPESVRFRHRLDGFDQNWVDDGSQRSARYGSLPFGTYRFRVQAGGVDNRWASSEAAISLLIPAPWWLTAWARAGYVFTAMGLIAFTSRKVSNRRLRRRLALLAQQQAMERERMRIAQDMHDEIGSKLTKISFMSESARDESAGESASSDPIVDKFDNIARTSRSLLRSLDEIVWAVNPHKDTLEHLAAYLGQYATEYLHNTAVECELNIPLTLPAIPVSSEIRHNLYLAFAESLNNALKHGQASKISVEMRVHPYSFEIEVIDNGLGFDVDAVILSSHSPAATPVTRLGNGIHNLRDRLQTVGGTCTIRSQPGSGTSVVLAVPLENGRK